MEEIDENLAHIHEPAEFVFYRPPRRHHENDYLIEDHVVSGTYEIGEKHLEFNDPVWGREMIGDKPYDQLLVKLAKTPVFERSLAIEQLTLPSDYATMPNTTQFSRWQHVWGGPIFIRKMVEGRDDIDDRQKMVLQLRALVSDVAHTAFSHLGDWVFQGKQGGEDMHDRDLEVLLKATGIEDLLQSYDFTLAEVVFPDIEDWVECKSPGLCVDRVDYGIREILRWGAPSIALNMFLRELQNPQSLFEITDAGQLVVKDLNFGKLLAAGFNILPTEHWSHPVHRLQLQLFQSAVQGGLADKVAANNMHPRDAMYGIDDDFNPYLQTWPMLHLRRVMKTIGLTQRQIFTIGRRQDLNRVFSRLWHDKDWQFPEFPDPMKSYSWESEQFIQPYPPEIILEEASVSSDGEMLVDEKGLTVELPPLKARAIDPLIKTEAGATKKLSEIEPSYLRFLEGQKKVMAKSYKATVLMRPDIAQKIIEQHNETLAEWPRLLMRQRNPEWMTNIIDDTQLFVSSHSLESVRRTEKEMLRRLAGAAAATGVNIKIIDAKTSNQ